MGGCERVLKKPEHIGQKLVLLVIFFALLALWYLGKLPCIFRAVTGIPCVTCGLTRAWLCALRLDLRGAFLQYPMFWSFPILVLYLFYEGSLFRNKPFNNLLLGCILTGIFGIWLARIFGFLGVLSPL
jgi:hypothetical protein